MLVIIATVINQNFSIAISMKFLIQSNANQIYTSVLPFNKIQQYLLSTHTFVPKKNLGFGLRHSNPNPKITKTLTQKSKKPENLSQKKIPKISWDF
jgi:hypothetical protein